MISVDYGWSGNTLNPTDQAGVVPAINWNNLTLSGTVSLLENDGLTSGGTVTWGGALGMEGTGGAITGPDSKMMYGYLDAGHGVLTATFSGLPSALNNVYVYVAGQVPGGRLGDYTIGATTILATEGSSTAPYTLAGNGTAGNYIEFANVSGSSFTLTAGSTQFRAPVDGIQIVPVPTNTFIWTGAQSSEWSTNVLSPNKNWAYNGAAGDYVDGSPVIFDDGATGTSTADITADVYPSSVTFNNTAKPYTLQSSGGFAIAGATGLTMSGGGVLTITNANKFTGPVTFAGGTVAVPSVAIGGQNSPLGAGTSLIFNGGALEYTGVDATPGTDRSVTLNASGGTFQVDNTTTILTLSGSISGTGGLTKAGSGTLALNNVNTYAGATTINSGVLNFTTGALSLGNITTNKIYFGPSGTLQWGNNTTTDVSANLAPIAAGQSATFDTQNNNVTFASGLPTGGAGTIIKAGSGQLTVKWGAINGIVVSNNLNDCNIASLQMTAGTLESYGYLWMGSSGWGSGSGTVTQSGGLFREDADIIINRGGNHTGTSYNISAGTLQVNTDQYAIEADSGANNVAAFNQTGGLVQLSSLDMFRGSAGQAGQFNYNLSAGTLALTTNNWPLPGTLWTGNLTGSNTAPGVFTISNSNAQFNFTGGVFQVLTIDRSMTDILQLATSASSLLDVTGNNTAINVNYSASSSSNLATIDVGSGHSLTMGASSTLAIGNGGVLVVSGSLAGGSGTSLALANSGEGLQIGSGGLVSIPTVNLAGLASTSAIRFNGATTGGTISSPSLVLQNSNETFNVDRGTSAYDLTVSGAITDGGGGYGLIKNGAGILLLSGTNTYDGTTIVNSGSLVAATTASLPGYSSAGTVSVAAGATLGVSVGTAGWGSSDIGILTTSATFAPGSFLGLDTTVAGSFTQSDAIGGGLGLNKLGSGLLVLTNTGNSYSGGTILTTGMLNFANGALPLSPNSITFNGGTLQWANGNTQDVSASIAPIASGITAGFDTNGNNISFGTPITDSGNLNKLGSGTLSLAAGTTISGTTTIAAGTLNFPSGALSTGTNSIVAGDGTLQWAAGNTQDISAALAPIAAGQSLTFDTNGNNVTLSKGLPAGGAGTMIKTGSGQLIIGYGANYVGGISISNNAGFSNISNLQVTAGTLHAYGYLWLGGDGGGTTAGSITQTGGLFIDDSDIIINRYGNHTGTSYNISAGTLQVNTDQYAIEADSGANNVAAFNQTGGLVKLSSLDMFRGSAGQAGQFNYNLSAGTLALTTNNWPLPGTMWTGNLSSSNKAPGVFTISNSNAQFNFTGGVFQVLDIDRSMTDITQLSTSGPSLLDVTGNNTTIGVNYTLTGNSANAATVNIGAGHTLTMVIGTTLTLGDYAQFGVGSGTLEGAVAVTASTDAAFAGTIADNTIFYPSSLLKSGAGTLILSGTDTYTGGTDVEGGTLQAMSSDAIPYGSSLIVGTNGTVEIGNPLGAGAAMAHSVAFAAPSGAVVAAVPEPGTLALLAVGALAAFGVWRRRKTI